MMKEEFYFYNIDKLAFSNYPKSIRGQYHSSIQYPLPFYSSALIYILHCQTKIYINIVEQFKLIDKVSDM
jgi:hypothetical protein